MGRREDGAAVRNGAEMCLDLTGSAKRGNPAVG
jgi:hypothetical protein